MRTALLALCILAGVSSAARGQSSPYLATVAKSGAQLHINPTNQSPATETLKEGTQLLIDHEEENGMLAVQPGAGNVHSLSWVQIQFIADYDLARPTPQNVTVAEDTTLAPGQVGSAEPIIYYRKTQVPAGTILTVIGPRATVVENGVKKSWYPVLPPAGDFRYVSRDSVKVDRPVNTSFTIRENPAAPLPGSSTGITPVSANIPPQPIATLPVIGPPAAPVGSNPAASAPVASLPAGGAQTTSVPASIPLMPPVSSKAAPAAPPKPVVNNPLWAQAEAAEQEGRLADAEKLYFQLARLMNEPGGDRDVANLCYTRIHAIREKIRANASSARPVGAPAPLAVTSTVTTVSGQLQAEGNLKPGVAASGKISHSPLWVEGRVTYVIEPSPGQQAAYVVAAPGVDLEKFLNRRVDVYGTTSPHRNLSLPLVVASNAEVLPEKKDDPSK